MVSIRKALTLAPLILAGCVGAPIAPPPPRPVIYRPAPPPPLAVAPEANWESGVLTPGSWSYTKDSRGGLAVYGVSGAGAVTVRCDVAQRRVFVSRTGNVAGQMTLRATTGARSYEAKPTAGGVSYVTAELSPTDPQLDALAFSRGRFLVGLTGAPDMVVSSGPEVARVVEDCRG